MDTAEALRPDGGAGVGETGAVARFAVGDVRAGVAWGSASASDTGGLVICKLGDYWCADRDERTEIGELVHRAKDLGDPAAAADLAERFGRLAEGLPAVDGDRPRLVVPVPFQSYADGDADPIRLTELLAAALAAAGAGEYRPSLVVRSNRTARLRHVDPEHRAEMAASAGYGASEPVAGRHVVVVDDVVLTGATLIAVAACLHDAGAASVTAAVAARTRLS